MLGESERANLTWFLLQSTTLMRWSRICQRTSTVATIGDKNSRPVGIGNVNWSWQEDDDKLTDTNLRMFTTSLNYHQKQVRNALVKVQQSKLQDDVLTYNVLFPNGSVQSTTREFLHQPEHPEIANIPVTPKTTTTMRQPLF
jgi:hypothetical protein